MASGEGADFLLATLAVLVLFLAVAAVAAAAAGAGPFARPARGGGAPPPYSGPCLGPDSDAEGPDSEGSDSDGSDCSDAEGSGAEGSDGCSSVSVGAPGPGAREALLDPCADSEADSDSDADSEADSDAGPLGRPRGLVSESDRFGAPAPAAEGRTRRLEVRLPPVAWRPPAGAAEFHGPDGPGVAPGFAPHPALPDHDEPE
jgi:hypothetical protein